MASAFGLLTPGPSSDISGQKADGQLSNLDASFTLPPAAINSAETRSSSVSTSSTDSKGSDSSYRPASPPSPATHHKPSITGGASSSPSSPSHTRKRSTAQRSNVPADDYALPPPPTRTRKIIQMKPKSQDAHDADKATKSSGSKSSPGKGSAAEKDGTSTTAGVKRKASNGNTAANRKVARKTAHSLIERRRRSKMNEEFGILKDMIPACSGQEMHKLAILQASIDYMRYLEKCVNDLKAANKSRGSSVSKSPHGLQPRQHSHHTISSVAAQQYDEDVEDSDEEMSDVDPSASDATPSNPPSTFSVVSPQILGSAQTSPALTAGSQQPQQIHFRQPLTLPSPAFTPQQGSRTQRKDSTVQSPTTTLPSPALLPQADHEATAALMMLGTDRRSWDDKSSERRSMGGARGISVRDLLSGS